MEACSYPPTDIQIRCGLQRKGYINLEFESVHESLKFPDAARHTVLITTHEFKLPVQHLLRDTFSLLEGEIEEQYTLARVFLQASQPMILHVPRYDFQLLAEDRNMKIYGSPYLHRRFFDVPFLNHITKDVSLIFHIQSMIQQQLSSNHEDFLDSYATEIPPGCATEIPGLDILQDIDQRDTDDMIET